MWLWCSSLYSRAMKCYLSGLFYDPVLLIYCVWRGDQRSDLIIFIHTKVSMVNLQMLTHWNFISYHKTPLCDETLHTVDTCFSIHTVSALSTFNIYNIVSKNRQIIMYSFVFFLPFICNLTYWLTVIFFHSVFHQLYCATPFFILPRPYISFDCSYYLILLYSPYIFIL